MLYPFLLVILVSSVFFRPTFEPLVVISNVQRAKVPGAKVPGNESSTLCNLSFPGAKVLWNESSCYRIERHGTYSVNEAETGICFAQFSPFSFMNFKAVSRNLRTIFSWNSYFVSQIFSYRFM